MEVVGLHTLQAVVIGVTVLTGGLGAFLALSISSDHGVFRRTGLNTEVHVQVVRINTGLADTCRRACGAL